MLVEYTNFFTDEADLDCDALREFPGQMVTSLLTAMKEGSSEARSLFPRLLQLADTYMEVRENFVSMVSYFIIIVML